jgi:glucokinase
VSGDRVIAVDVGGTKILAGVVTRDGASSQEVERETPTTSEADLLAAISATVDELRDDTVAGVGLGLPCNLEPATGLAYRATNLPLEGVEVLSWARAEFGLPVGVENDGNASALAEWRLGAGRGARTLVVLVLGTGIGGGIVLDGHLYRGWAELGHVVVDYDGVPCQGSCHGRGHLEGLATGVAASRVARELFGDGADAHVLVTRAWDGDARAVEALERIGRYVGAAIGSFVNMFDPDLVVVGGGFGAAAGELILAPARAAARREAIQPADTRLRIEPAALGDRAGLVGAALVAFEAVDGDR